MTNAKKYIWCLAFGAFVAFIFFAPAHPQALADDSLSITITPPFFNLNVSPGDAWASSIKVVNTNAAPLTVYATVAGFTPSDEEGHGTFVDLSSLAGDSDSLANWISANSGPVTIAPGGTGEIPFSFDVPQGASPGGHYAAILIGTAPGNSGTQGSHIGVSSYISSLIFVTVSGNVDAQGSIDEFTSDQSLYQSPDAKFTLLFHNSGNVHVKPVGTIEIYNAFGKERGVIDVNQTGTLGYVLPSSSREFDFEWRGQTSWFDIGPYTAVATLDYGDNAVKSVSDTISFWILPIWKLLGVAGGTIFFIIIFVIAIRRYVRRALALEMRKIGGPDRAETPLAPLYKEQGEERPRLRLRTLGEPVREGVVDLRNAYEEAIIGKKEGQKGFDWGRYFRSLRRYIIFGILFLLILLGIIWMSLYISALFGNRKSYETKNNSAGETSQWVRGVSGQ